jgi:hypothetical protein
MGAFSIWHLVIVFVFLGFLPIAAPLLPLFA